MFNTDPWSVAAEEGEWVVRVPGYLRPPRAGSSGASGTAGSLSLECCGKPEESFTFSFSPFLLFVTFKIFGYFSVSTPYSRE